jgi:hypothetical protein
MASTLSDIANWAQILSVPTTIFVWFVTAERFAKFWKRWFRWLFVIVLCLGFVGLSRLGWLNWLTKPIQLPLWAAVFLFLLGFLLIWITRAIGPGWFGSTTAAYL